MELDGIFLDLYGTLTSGDRAAVESTCEAIVRDTGVRLSAHELSITWGDRFLNSLDFHSGEAFLTLRDLEEKTLRETMSALGVAIEPQRYVDMLMHYWQNPPIHDEVHEFLRSIGVPICLVSNADRADAVAALRRHEIRLHDVVTSEDARSYKPDPGIFEYALRRTGWQRERVIHVGDSLHSDIGGAKLAGLRSAWLNRAHRIHDIGTHEPDYEFEDLRGLVRMLNGA